MRKYKVEEHFCSFNYKDIPCPHRSQYRFHFDDGQGNHDCCHHHMAGMMLIARFGGEAPHIYALVMN